MSWDNIRMAQKFLQRANAIYPDDQGTTARMEETLALQDVYYDCYMSSFSREALMTRLYAILDGKIELPEDQEVDEQNYKAAYMREARVILTSVESGKL